MAGMNILQMIKTIPKFDGENFVEWTRSFNGILQLSWHFLSKIVSGFERQEPILLRGNREREDTGAFDDNDSIPRGVSGHDSGSLNEKPQKVTTFRPGTQQMSIYLAF